jgi:hypothetical protein
MSIYFKNRSLQNPLYKNEDYRRQQRQFITVLRSRTDSFSLKVCELDMQKGETRRREMAHISIDLRDVSNIIVACSESGLRTSLHELFKVWSRSPEADWHAIDEEIVVFNLEEFLGECHDILTVKFDEEWKKLGA